MSDPDLQIRWRGGGGGGGRSSRPLDKGEAVSKNIFSVLRASVWSKNKGEGGPQAPSLDPPLLCKDDHFQLTRK